MNKARRKSTEFDRLTSAATVAVTIEPQTWQSLFWDFMVAQNTPMLKFVRYSFSKGYGVHRRLDLILLDVPYDATQVIAHRFAVVEYANGNEAVGVLLENLLHRILSHMRLDATVVNEID